MSEPTQQSQDPSTGPPMGAAPGGDLDTELIRSRVAARLFGEEAEPLKIARYVVGERLGAGGMGVVYAARDVDLERSVALKVLRERGDDVERDRRRARLTDEARALARLSHPNVVQIYEVGAFEGSTFLSLELVEGTTMAQWQRVPGRRWDAILRAYLDAARGLAAAHAVGVIHRDVKPTNILVDREGRVRVADFGLARAETEVTPVVASAPSGDDTPRSLRSDALAGTPAYMAPELFDGATADVRSDVFSLCVSLFEGLYGDRPFTVEELVSARAADRSTRELRARIPRTSPVPRWVLHVLAAGLHPDPRRRTADMDGLIAGFLAVPRRRRRAGVVTSAALALGLGGWGVVTTATAPPTCPPVVDELPGVWDEAIKAALRERFVATRLPYAAASWRLVERSLDAAVHELSAARRRTCERTRVEGSQSAEQLDLASSCLDRQARQIHALTTFLGEGGSEVVARAHVLTDELGDPARCLSTDVLRGGPAAPPSEQLRRRVEAAQAQLREIGFLTAIERYDGVRARLDALVEEGAIYPPLRAEALYRRGRLAVGRGLAEEAAADLKEAAALADEVGDDRLAAVALGELVELLAADQRAPAEARGYALLYGAKLRRSEAKAREFADYAHRLGVIEFAARDYGAARGLYEEAIALRPASDIEGRAHDLRGLANAQAELRELDASIARSQEARDFITRELGAAHPEAGVVAYNLALSLTERGDLGEAEALLHEALEIERRYSGEASVGVARTRTAFADLHLRRGALEAARAELSPALEVFRAELPPAHRDTINALHILVNVEREARAWGAAAAAQAELLRGKQASGQPVPFSYLLNAGEFFYSAGDYTSAIPYFDQLLVQVSVESPPDPMKLVYALNGRGKTHLATEEEGAALRLLRRALALLPEIEDPPADLLAEVWWGAAEALAAAGDDPAEATRFAVKAREAYASFDPEAPEIAAIDRFLRQR